MPSPFPGMDPYLEAPDIWPDFHDRLATWVSEALNGTLPAPYYARLVMRPEVGIVDDEEAERRRLVPDVAVIRRPGPQQVEGGVALLEAPRKTISPSLECTLANAPIRHHFVEIRDPSRGHHLVTLIEIVSPSNKRPGPDRNAYLNQQREVLESDASLVEIDLLRAGRRLLPFQELEQSIALLIPPPDYVVLVNRAWRREGMGTNYQVFRARLAEPLPVVAVPLRQGQDDVPLDLQFVANRAYDGGPYRRGAVDYAAPPPVPEVLVPWAEECLRAAGLRPAPPG